MSDLAILIVSSLVGGGGLVGGLLAWRKDHRQGPIEQTTATIANAMSVSDVATKLVEVQSERMASQDKKIADLYSSVTELKAVTWMLQARLSDWANWYMDLSNRWPYHRGKLAPPDSPESAQSEYKIEGQNP